MSLLILAWLMAAPTRADSFPSWFAKAQKAEARQDDEAALQAWSNALHLWKSGDSKPQKSKALAARAALYEKKGEWEAALSDLSGALKLETKDARLFYRRGSLCLEHGRTAEAISDFYKATALKLDYADAFFDRGRAYETQGDADFAKEDFKTACHLGLKKACEKAGSDKAAAKAPRKPKSKETAAPAVQPSTAAAKPPKAGAPPETPDIQVGSAVEEIPVGESPGGEEAPPEESPMDFRACISRIRSCSDSGNSYSACVSRARLCEKEPKLGCCPRDCVVLFKKRINSKSEAEAFREVFRPGSICVAPKAPKAEDPAEETLP